MSSIEILGWGMHPFGRWPDKLPAEMADVAVRQALGRARIDAGDIDVVYTGHTVPGSGGGGAVAAALGIRGVPVLNLDQACASSATATVLAAMALTAGQFNTALVLGFEKMPRGFLRDSRPHGEHERMLGLDLQPGRYALKASRYLAAYDAPEALLAEITVKSRRHAMANENAHLRVPATAEDVLAAPMIASPLTRLQCCPTSDGAAAIILRRRPAGSSGQGPAIAGWSLGTITAEESCAAGVPESFTRRLASQAYEHAGIGPEDIGVAQVHDAFSIAEPLRLEALGLVPDGQGLYWNKEGATSLGGRIPTNTDGGLLSRGHPVGATGLAQLIEVAKQLAEETGDRQIHPRPSAGVCQNLGGGENGGGVVLVLNR
jgi:acetyl-CoA acetyltransferase